jgi:hypothetical protein
MVAGNSAAVAEPYRSDAVHVDGISGNEARGRDQIKAAFAQHLQQIRYAAMTLSGWGIVPAQETDDGCQLTVRLHWEWRSASGDTALYGIPAVSRILIDIESPHRLEHPPRPGGALIPQMNPSRWGQLQPAQGRPRGD